LADGTVRLRCRGEDEARVYEMAFRHRAFQHLDLVTCAVTLACGGAGAHFGADHLAAMAARLTGARIDVHPDLGHFGPMEAPAQVAAAVTAAFAAVDSSPSGP
jgi:pimeloyl-ACP methyl ester carboxylesterase